MFHGVRFILKSLLSASFASGIIKAVARAGGIPGGKDANEKGMYVLLSRLNRLRTGHFDKIAD
ncbi:MAG: hypothetical protein ACXW2W_02445 [Telluria sp.]